jgi:hypothetical protein
MVWDEVDVTSFLATTAAFLGATTTGAGAAAAFTVVSLTVEVWLEAAWNKTMESVNLNKS